MTYEKELRNQKIAELYQQGMTLAAIGKLYDMSRQAVQQILIDRGIPRRSTGRRAPAIAFAQEQPKA